MNKRQQTETTEDTITLYLAQGEVECDILAVFSLQEQFYIALMPQTPVEGYAEGEYFLYRYASDGNEVSLTDIDSEEELEAVEDKFEELLDEDEFNRME